MLCINLRPVICKMVSFVCCGATRNLFFVIINVIGKFSVFSLIIFNRNLFFIFRVVDGNLFFTFITVDGNLFITFNDC